MSESATPKAVSCFAFNADCSKVALCPNDNRILLFNLPSPTSEFGRWALDSELKKHDSLVSSLDWSAASNQIVSCGHDRNAYVWKHNEETREWEPSLVILRINRSANCVRWNQSGTKFAVGSSAKMVPVCRYEKNNDWWVSKMIKRHKSTVLSVSWHPNNAFLLTGGCDFKCRIFSAFIKETDNAGDTDAFSDIFEKRERFGALLAEIDGAKGWVEGVSWSPCGFAGAFVSHDPAITFFRIQAGESDNITTQKIEMDSLPCREVVFLSEDSLIAAGHDCNPRLYTKSGEDWVFSRKVDQESSGKDDSGQKVSAFAANKALFQTSSSQGRSLEDSGVSNSLKTRHQNQIVGLYSCGNGCSEGFYSCGMDGKILHWMV